LRILRCRGDARERIYLTYSSAQARPAADAPLTIDA
jgi:hypothetical protein